MPGNPRFLLHNDETAPLAEMLTEAFPKADVAECNSYKDLPGLIDTFRPDVVYTVRFAGTPGYPRDALFGPSGPRWVSNGGAGTDHFGQWDPEVTTVTNAAGVAAGMMAEYILGGFLHFTLDVPGLQADKAAKLWQARTVRPLAGQTLLIVGLGHTGQALASRAKALGMTVIGTRARPQPMADVDEVHAADDLMTLLSRADFVAVSTPLTKATRGMISKAAIDTMKPGAILADVSRGGVVDQAALHEALGSGHLSAAVLDVFEVEPLPAESPLWSLKNVLLSPHCASVFPGWDKASFEMFLANLDRWQKGEPLQNVVDPGRGY